jgi:hypothetical protein
MINAIVTNLLPGKPYRFVSRYLTVAVLVLGRQDSMGAETGPLAHSLTPSKKAHQSSRNEPGDEHDAQRRHNRHHSNSSSNQMFAGLPT